ncbi:YheU family protein [Glaciecola sp. 1036]|uniref:YheU family protein n=1 Tax=Alteromonadaceae TaxID=72275 RepID=UPI003CFEC776
MIIPYQEIQQDTLINLIESFVLREGTDYGEDEKSLEEKVQDILTQLQRKEVVIQYSEEYESINIVPKDHLKHSE